MTRKRDVRIINCLLDQAPEDRPLRKPRPIIGDLTIVDLRQPDRVDLPLIGNLKRALKRPRVELFILLPMVHFPPALPVSRHPGLR
jgi:hypothetical protein